MKNENVAISWLQGLKSKKQRTLSFLQLLKFEKVKCPYFFDLLPGAEILTISFSDDNSNLTPSASKEEMVISWLLGIKKTLRTHYVFIFP